MQQDMIVSRELINGYLDQLKTAKQAYDLAETNWDCIIRQHSHQDEVKAAFRRKKQTSEHYIAISEWLLKNTPHGFYYDPVTDDFKLR